MGAFGFAFVAVMLNLLLQDKARPTAEREIDKICGEFITQRVGTEQDMQDEIAAQRKTSVRAEHARLDIQNWGERVCTCMYCRPEARVLSRGTEKVEEKS